MTGSGAFRCICCQIIRNLQLSRRKSLLFATRPSDRLLTLATYQYLHTSRLLQKTTKSTGDDDGTSSNSSSDSSSDSDNSDSDDERSTGGLRDGSERIDTRRSDDGAGVLRGKKEAINVGQDLGDEDDGVKIDPKLVSAAKEVAESLEGDSNKTEAALLSQLLTAFKTANYQQRSDPPKQTKKVYSQMLDDDENTESVLFTKKRSNQSKKSSDRSVKGSNEYLDLFNAKRLGVFDLKSSTKPTGSHDLFDVVEEEGREALQNYPPRNAWEEQIQWTKQGKLWTFPIDNEAGWSEEKNVSFQHHVFLHNHLTDFPRYGPLRHFMELVTLALSKNPYLTIQQKQEHIQWFRDYFMEKEAVLVTKLGDEGVIKKSSASN